MFTNNCRTTLASAETATTRITQTTMPMLNRSEAVQTNSHQNHRHLCVPNGAAGRSRTDDIELGRIALYQLSYSRFVIHSRD